MDTEERDHGESKDLVNRAVEHEVSLPVTSAGRIGRVTSPLIAPEATPAVLITNEGIADALNDEDVERYATE